MNILITGITGMLGKDIGRIFLYNGRHNLYGIGRHDCFIPGVKYTKVDLEDEKALRQYLSKHKVDVIIHCAAITDMDFCEMNPQVAFKVNVEASGILAEYCNRMIYISSGAVFDGSKGDYTEDSEESPISVYGKTKLLGEKAVFASNSNSIALRLSLYGFGIASKLSLAQWAAYNIKSRIQISGFCDMIFNPLYTTQVAEVIDLLLEKKYVGVLNIGTSEIISKYDLFCMIADKMNLPARLIEKNYSTNISLVAARIKKASLNVHRLNTILNRPFSVEEGMTQFYYDYLKWL